MNRKRTFIIIVAVTIILVILTCCFLFFRSNLIKYVSKYINAYVEANVVNTLNNSSTDAINKYKEVFSDFIDIDYDEKKNVKLLNVNMLYINCLQRDIASMSLQYLIEYCDTHSVEIPSGAFLGSVLFSGLGRGINVKVIPIGSTDAKYRVNYESVAVNSTRFSIYIDIFVNCRIAVPFYTEDVNVSTSVLVVESIIQGEVPPFLLSQLK